MDARVRGAIFIAAVVAVPAGALAQPAKPGEKPDAEAETVREPEPGDAAAAPAVPPATRVPDDGAAAAPSEPVAPPPGFTWEPYGYLRLQYVFSQNDPNVAFVGRDDGFELQNARVGVRGKLDTRAAFVISFDGAVDERAQINVPEGKLRVGLRDAYVDLGVAGDIVVRAGFFHALVDPQSLIPDTSRAFADKPIESRGVRATEGFQTQGLTPGRSLGAAVRLDPNVPASGVRMGFEIAVQNGADEYASNNDNDKPAVSASGLVRLAGDSHVVASVRYNPRTVGDLPFRQDETDLQAAGGAQLNLGPVALGAGGVFVRTTFSTTGGPTQNAFGAHAQAMVRVGDELAVGYRFGVLDPSSLILTDRVMEHTAGAVLGVPRYRMRLQLQGTHAVEQRALSNSRIQLAAEVSL
ncbi:MAG: hypothetical protein H0T89_22515 [Deltaproteobacteria bacterium]|nr:hypothetical protein [Deltaproteobacteria bacterium]MDQ3295216.1 OprO/OprP family phosphate-selective porin [Myxococcota bacterium]